MNYEAIRLLLPPSVFLIGAGSLLISGKLPVPALVRSRLRWGIALLVGAVLIWLLLGARADERIWQLTPGAFLGDLTPPLALRANAAGRLLAMALTAITVAAVLAGGRQRDANDPDEAAGDGLDWALLLLLLTAALATLLPANLFTLALAWTAMDGIVGAAWLLTTRMQQGALLHWGAGAAGTLLLWSAALPLHANLAAQRIPLSLPQEGWVGIALILAATLRLAPFPFHLGRPYLVTDDMRNAALKTGLQIVPLAAAIWLLAQVPLTNAVPFLSQQFITALLVTGLVGSGLLAWLPSEDHRAIRWVLGGQAAMTVLAALWTGPETALAQGLTLLLGGGLLLLFAGRRDVAPEDKVAAGIGIAALVGLPLTWGGDGRIPLYQAWLDRGWGLYLFIAAGAWLLILGSAARLFFRPLAPSGKPLSRLVSALGASLPALGLLLRGGSLPHAAAPVWLAIALPAAGGVLLAWESDSLRPLQRRLELRLHPILALHWLRQAVGRAADLAGRLAHAVHHVLEGEGAMLWLLVLLALAWLLLKTAAPG